MEPIKTKEQILKDLYDKAPTLDMNDYPMNATLGLILDAMETYKNQSAEAVAISHPLAENIAINIPDICNCGGSITGRHDDMCIFSPFKEQEIKYTVAVISYTEHAFKMFVSDNKDSETRFVKVSDTHHIHGMEFTGVAESCDAYRFKDDLKGLRKSCLEQIR